MLGSGSVVRISERENGGVAIHVSQGFSHKKYFRTAKSYSDLRFHLSPPIPGVEGNGILLLSRIFMGLENVRDCLVSGPCSKKEEFFLIIGECGMSPEGNFQWETARFEPLDLSTLLTVTPRRCILTFLEAVYPLKYQYRYSAGTRENFR
jgi:hypothetical protein